MVIKISIVQHAIESRAIWDERKRREVCMTERMQDTVLYNDCHHVTEHLGTVDMTVERWEISKLVAHMVDDVRTQNPLAFILHSDIILYCIHLVARYLVFSGLIF